MSQNQVMQERLAVRQQRREERQRQRERQQERTSQQLLTEKNNNGTPISANLKGSGAALSSQQNHQNATSKKGSSPRDLNSLSEGGSSNNNNHVNPSLMDTAKLSLRGSAITSAQHQPKLLESHITETSSAVHGTASVRRDSGSSALGLKPPSKDTKT